MDSNQQYSGPHAVCEIAADHQALQIMELRDRVRDLEGDNAAYRALACAALENVSALTARNKMLALRIDNLNGQLRELMGCAKGSRGTNARDEAERTIAAMRLRQARSRLTPPRPPEPSWTM